MLVAVPAGGGRAHLSQALPALPLLCCGESDRWRPKVSAMLLQSVQLSLAWRQRARGIWWWCPAPSPPPPQGSIAYREGSPPSPISTTNPLLPPRGRAPQLQLCFVETSCFQWDWEWVKGANMEDVKLCFPRSIRTHSDAWGLSDRMERTQWWCMAEVKGSCQKPPSAKVHHRIAWWLLCHWFCGESMHAVSEEAQSSLEMF